MSETKKNAVRPALAVSIGSSGRRFVDKNALQRLGLASDEFSVDLGFILRAAGLWECLSRAQKLRIKRMPMMRVTTETQGATRRGQQRKR
ncbi:hypothetical protein J2045_001941 [Peteryoungia aggregata LMG 23059]|uniref:Uncharacterized protein n=1 Tax=Peteryoungia aggregata LMG 23059 TaxID=1368425 RepID=A0ABU0G6E5_9HYPH|nr:hypothetical protein [Peteryoungia aggregata]MDQ0420914.1 hypothetical protein [Peteryoungia aggregata LMG 23059]